MAASPLKPARPAGFSYPGRAFRDPWQDLALTTFCLSSPERSGAKEGAVPQTLKTNRGRDDQAPRIQVQTRPPDGPEHLGPSEKPGEPARIRPRPARPAPQEQALRLWRAAQGQAEAARLLRQYFRKAVPRHLWRSDPHEGR